MLGKEEMHKNTFKPLCMLAAITLAFGISTSSAHAADTDLSITQKIDKITGKESQQKYTVNYTGENKNTALKIEYDRGFYAKELKVASTDDGIMDESPGGHESAAQKAKETVSDNRGVQLGLIIGGIVLAGIVIVIIVSKRMGKEEISTVTKEEEKPDTVEDQESGSLDQSEELNKDDTKEPKP